MACDFVENFPKHFLKKITFLHPLGVCEWTFHRTGPLKVIDWNSIDEWLKKVNFTYILHTGTKPRAAFLTPMLMIL